MIYEYQQSKIKTLNQKLKIQSEIIKWLKQIADRDSFAWKRINELKEELRKLECLK